MPGHQNPGSKGITSLGVSGHVGFLGTAWLSAGCLGLPPCSWADPRSPSHPLVRTALVVGGRGDREVALLTRPSPPKEPEAGVRPHRIPGPQWSMGVIEETGTRQSHPRPTTL